MGRFVCRPGVIPDPSEIAENIPNDKWQESAHEIIKRIQRGEYQVFEVHENGVRVGFTIYTTENGEFLSVASVAKNEANSMAAEWIPIIEQLAKEHNCQSARMHTIRPGLVKSLLSEGWHVSEVVMRKEI
jgi:hypothetical protein